jgi:hypothetical protein
MQQFVSWIAIVWPFALMRAADAWALITEYQSEMSEIDAKRVN